MPVSVPAASPAPPCQAAAIPARSRSIRVPIADRSLDTSRSAPPAAFSAPGLPGGNGNSSPALTVSAPLPDRPPSLPARAASPRARSPGRDCSAVDGLVGHAGLLDLVGEQAGVVAE